MKFSSEGGGGGGGRSGGLGPFFLNFLDPPYTVRDVFSSVMFLLPPCHNKSSVGTPAYLLMSCLQWVSKV